MSDKNTAIKWGLNPMQHRKRRIDVSTGRLNGPVPKKQRRSRFASVDCPIHGAVKELTRSMKADKREIYCSQARTKREHHSGCPMCDKVSP